MIGRQPLGDDITWFSSTQPDTKQMDGMGGQDINGEMLLVLDSVLVDGYNEKTPSEVTSSGGSITFTFPEAHGYLLRQDILISGADDVALNGKHKIVSMSAFTISINTLGVTTLAGAIKTKVAPLGWESVIGSSDPMRRAYRSLNPATTQTVIHLDMSHPVGHGYNSTNPAKRAMIDLYKSIDALGEKIGSYTDGINKKAGATPNGALFWNQVRGESQTASVKTDVKSSWVVVGNGDYFYFMIEWTNYYNYRGKLLRDTYFFGDAPSFGGEADEYNCMLMSSYMNNGNGTVYVTSNGNYIGSSVAAPTTGIGAGNFFIKDIAGNADMEYAGLTPAAMGHNISSGSGGGILMPNTASQSLICLPIYATSNNNGLRAVMPRLLAIPQNLSSNKESYDLKVVDNILTVAVGTTSSGDGCGFLAFDLGD